MTEEIKEVAAEIVNPIPVPKKHQGFIIGLMAEYFTDKEEWKPEIATYDPNLFLEEVTEHLIVRQRAGLEKNKAVRQFLPYLIPMTYDAEGTLRFYPYQRCEGIGEATLLGKVSVGYGGHVDGKDIIYDDQSVILLKDTLLVAAARERYEEVEPQEEMRAEWNALKVELSGEFIASNDNATDAVHLACIAKLQCPDGMVLTCKEPELKTLPMMTARELLDSDYELESWTRKYLEYALLEPVASEEEVDAGFGNEVSSYNPLEKKVDGEVNRSIDEVLAVVYSAFIKKEEVVELKDYVILKNYERTTKGMPGFISCVSIIVEGSENPELGEQFFEHIKEVVGTYLSTRFAPDEMAEFNEGAVSMSSTDEEMASSVAALAVLQGLVELKVRMFGESISFDKYAVALGELCTAAGQVPIDDNNTEVATAMAAVVQAHHKTFEALGDVLTDTTLPIRIELESNPKVYDDIWTFAEKIIAPILAPMEDLAEALAEAMPEIVKEAASKMAAAEPAPVRKPNSYTPEDQ